MLRRLAYATRGYSTHDRRFVQAAVEGGWDVLYLRCDGNTTNLCDEPLPIGAEDLDWIGARQELNDSNWHDFAAALGQVLQTWGASVVHAGPVPTVGALAVASSPVPCVVMSWASDLLIDTEVSKRSASLARDALMGAAAVVVDCKTVARMAIDLGADQRRLVVVPWGVDLNQFRYSPREQGGADPLKLLSLRSFEPVYDVPTLLRGVAEATHAIGLGSIELVLAGSGSHERDLRSLAVDLGIAEVLTWVGRVSEPQVQVLLAQSDLHVSTSMCDGSSISLLQAMATGRPSVVSDIPSNQEWVTDSIDGWLFETGNAQSLGRVLTQAAADRCALFAMGSQARRRAEADANWSVNSAEVLAVYETLIDGYSWPVAQ